MSSLPKSTDQSTTARLVSDAGIPFAAGEPADPIVAWLDLMEVVDMLCPELPAHTTRTWTDFRL